MCLPLAGSSCKPQAGLCVCTTAPSRAAPHARKHGEGGTRPEAKCRWWAAPQLPSDRGSLCLGGRPCLWEQWLQAPRSRSGRRKVCPEPRFPQEHPDPRSPQRPRHRPDTIPAGGSAPLSPGATGRTSRQSPELLHVREGNSAAARWKFPLHQHAAPTLGPQRPACSGGEGAATAAERPPCAPPAAACGCQQHRSLERRHCVCSACHPPEDLPQRTASHSSGDAMGSTQESSTSGETGSRHGPGPALHQPGFLLFTPPRPPENQQAF